VELLSKVGTLLGFGFGFEYPLCIEEADDLGDCVGGLEFLDEPELPLYALSWVDLGVYCGGGLAPSLSILRSRRFVLRSSVWTLPLVKLYRAGFLSARRRVASSTSTSESSKT
jgi:hypothetical protein